MVQATTALQGVPGHRGEKNLGQLVDRIVGAASRAVHLQRVRHRRWWRARVSATYWTTLFIRIFSSAVARDDGEPASIGPDENTPRPTLCLWPRVYGATKISLHRNSSWLPPSQAAWLRWFPVASAERNAPEGISPQAIVSS